MDGDTHVWSLPQFTVTGTLGVVEGIETEEMKEKMAEMGCDYEQGYYFSKPLPPADFVKYMEAETNKGV